MKKLFITLLWLLPLAVIAQDGKTAPPPPEVFSKAEKMPQFPGGGEQAMYDYISKNLNYPYTAQERGIQGRVWVYFIVSKTGKVENVRICKGLDKACDAEVVRVIKAMPDWTPGQDKGKAVPVFYIVPIDFKAPTI